VRLLYYLGSATPASLFSRLRTGFSSPLAALVSLFMFLFTDSCAVLSSSFIRVVWHFSLVPLGRILNFDRQLAFFMSSGIRPRGVSLSITTGRMVASFCLTASAGKPARSANC
jgi:hypothetical protein